MSEERVRNLNLDRTYRIASTGDVSDPFVAGQTPAGEQVLMGVLENELLIALFFSTDGKYLRHEFFPVPFSPDTALLPGQQELQRGYVLQDAKQRWMAGLGMTPGPIYVRHFAFPAWRIGIAEWPLSEFPEVARQLAAGEPLEDEFHVEWQQQGRWVMHWNKEYWMTADGEIGDT